MTSESNRLQCLAAEVQALGRLSADDLDNRLFGGFALGRLVVEAVGLGALADAQYAPLRAIVQGVQARGPDMGTEADREVGFQAVTWFAQHCFGADQGHAAESRADLYDCIADAIGQGADGEPDQTTGKVADEAVGYLLSLVGDSDAMRVLQLARDRGRPVEERMQLIVRLDGRFDGYDSRKWADLLMVSPAAVRKTYFWRRERKASLGRD